MFKRNMSLFLQPCLYFIYMSKIYVYLCVTENTLRDSGNPP